MGIKTKIGLSVLLFLMGVCTLPYPAHCTSKYAGMYFTYYNENNEMHILFETDNGVDNDYDHRRLHFDYGEGCREPNWSYDYDDYNFWPDEKNKDYPGIPGMKDRRLWKMTATALTPGCYYDVRFRYRDNTTEDWKENWGHFYAPPKIGTEDNPTLQFYAYGDCKVIDDKDESYDMVKKVASAVLNHPGKKTFVLHVGDRVLSGGSPIGKYYYKYKGEAKLLHVNDNWNDYFLAWEKFMTCCAICPCSPLWGTMILR